MQFEQGTLAFVSELVVWPQKWQKTQQIHRQHLPKMKFSVLGYNKILLKD